jgi:hypothetical protein
MQDENFLNDLIQQVQQGRHLNIYIFGDILQSKTIMWIKVVLASGFHRHLNRRVLNISRRNII